MAIGASIGLPPSEVGELSWQEFQALSWHYNDLQSPDDDGVEAVSDEVYEAHLARLAAKGKLRTT